MNILACSTMGYLIGTINPSYIFAKIQGFDIRERGSGNAGASNAVITMGKLIGLLSALFDIIKAYTAVKVAAIIFREIPFARELAGAFCIVGHIFPVWMQFHGGKGLACLGGMVLAFNWRFFCILLTIELILALIIDYICVVPITASIILTLLHAAFSNNPPGTFILAIVSLLIFCKHLENLRRIKDGIEARFSYLWNKDKEIERLTKNKEQLEK